MSAVLPAPISPVITTKPSVNQIVDSMYALARAVLFAQAIGIADLDLQPERQFVQFEEF